MFPFCSQKSASYNYDLRKALSAVSDSIAVSRSSAVRPSVCAVWMSTSPTLPGRRAERWRWAEGANKETKQRTAEVKERLLSSAYSSCCGNKAIVVTARLEELTYCVIGRTLLCIVRPRNHGATPVSRPVLGTHFVCTNVRTSHNHPDRRGPICISGRARTHTHTHTSFCCTKLQILLKLN